MSPIVNIISNQQETINNNIDSNDINDILSKYGYMQNNTQRVNTPSNLTFEEMIRQNDSIQPQKRDNSETKWATMDIDDQNQFSFRITINQY